MKILLTGTTGYIGKSLLPEILKDAHEVVCCVRNRARFADSTFYDGNIQVIEVDFLDESTLLNIPEDIDVAYYLIHSMSDTNEDFEVLEKKSALNFRNRIEQTTVKQVIYLSGIVNDEKLSKHLNSRKSVEDILSAGKFHLTTLRAGIIVGAGSASFEIVRDLVDKLPLMVAPKWISTKSQPIAIRNVIEFLKGVMRFQDAYDQSFDIGGPDILTYREMLLGFAKVRKLQRWIITVPVLTPKLSSYWLYFVTSTSYTLASSLVSSMSVEVICKKNNLHKKLNIELLSYEQAIQQALAAT